MQLPPGFRASGPTDDPLAMGAKPTAGGCFEHQRPIGLRAARHQPKSVGAVCHLAGWIEADLPRQCGVDGPVIGQGDRPEIGTLGRHEPGAQPARRQGAGDDGTPCLGTPRHVCRRSSAVGTRRCRSIPPGPCAAATEGTAGPLRARRRAAHCRGRRRGAALPPRRSPAVRRPASSRARHRRGARHGRGAGSGARTRWTQRSA